MYICILVIVNLNMNNAQPFEPHPIPIDCAREPGALAWISAMPLEEHGFCLDKSSFRDALCLRYGWQLPNMSHKCACGIPLIVDHAMVCHKGGIPAQRHN